MAPLNNLIKKKLDAARKGAKLKYKKYQPIQLGKDMP